MCGIRLDRYAVLSGLCSHMRYSTCIHSVRIHRVKTLCWDMPSLRDFLDKIIMQVLKGRHIIAWGFNPMNGKRGFNPMNEKCHNNPMIEK